MSKLTNNREILDFQTAVLAEPSDQKFLDFFSLQNPTPLRGFGEKSWPPPPLRAQLIPVIFTCDLSG